MSDTDSAALCAKLLTPAISVLVLAGYQKHVMDGTNWYGPALQDVRQRLRYTPFVGDRI